MSYKVILIVIQKEIYFSLKASMDIVGSFPKSMLVSHLSSSSSCHLVC